MLRATYFVISTLTLPFLAILVCLKPRLRKYWRERFGGGSYHEFENLNSPVWFHGASVGEIAGLSPLVSKISERLGADAIFVTTTSETGQDEIKRRGLTPYSTVLPFDSPLLLKPLVRKVKPRCVVIAETEIWPGLLSVLEQEGIPVFLINARISDLSYPGYQKLRFFLKSLLPTFEYIVAQTPGDEERLIYLGASQSKIEVGGNTKYDQSAMGLAAEARSSLRRGFGISEDSLCFVAGSVRRDEDRIVLDAFLEARKQLPRLQMIFAPRHPERFEISYEMLTAAGLNVSRSSEGGDKEGIDVLLLDTMGELKSAYAAGDIAFIGGTLIPIGGHNPMEAAIEGLPVILGPEVGNIRDAVSLLESNGGLYRANDTAELTDCILRLGLAPSELERVGAAARASASSCVGATELVLHKLAQPLGLAESQPIRTAAGA